MKKVMYVVMMLIVVLLPSLGHSQERTGNETVPAYNVWLPVVRHEDLCLTSGINHGWWGSRYPDTPRYYGFSVWLYNVNVADMHPFSEPTFTIARDEALTDIVANGGGWSLYSPPTDVIWEISPGFAEKNIGETYYVQFSYRCAGRFRAMLKEIVVEDCPGCIIEDYTTRAQSD